MTKDTSLNALRAIPAGMLAAAAAVLGGASKLAELGARRLAPRADASEPRHPSFVDTSRDTFDSARRSSTATLYDAEADTPVAAPLDVEDVTTDDLVSAADFAAELDADDPLVADPLVADDELGDVAGDTVVADDAVDAMLADAMADPVMPEAVALADTGPAVTVGDDTAADVPARDGRHLGVATAESLATDALDAAVLGDDGEARSYESHIAELADRNVASVVREIQDLSTEELGQLFEYESAHRKRKTVLQAIERATAPGEG